MPDDKNKPSSQVLPKTTISPHDPKAVEAARVVDSPKDAKAGAQATNPVNAPSEGAFKVSGKETEDTSKHILQPKPPTEAAPKSPDSLLPAPNVVVVHDPDDPKFRSKMVSGKDWDKATEHLNEVRKGALKKAGSMGFNPYLWLATYVEPLEKQLRAKQYTDGLYNEIMALSKEPDTRVK